MNQRTKLILGILGAAAAGVAIGMLLAPDSGTATRRNISRTAGTWANSLGDVLSNAKGQLTSAKARGKMNGRRMANKADDFL